MHSNTPSSDKLRPEPESGHSNWADLMSVTSNEKEQFYIKVEMVLFSRDTAKWLVLVRRLKMVERIPES